MNTNTAINFIPWRFYLIVLIICLAAMGLMWRVFDLAILKQHFLNNQGDQRVLRLMSTPAFRGMILDRNGFPLAISTTVYSAWMNPKEFVSTPESLASLSQKLHIPSKTLAALYTKQFAKHREFVYLKRGLSPEDTQQIKSLNIPGIYFQQEYRRFYPEGETTAHVVGFTNIDDHGQEGSELAYNEWLQGEPGKKWVIKDRLGRVIDDVQLVQKEQAGKNLTLSIDRRIQYVAYRELLNAVSINKAASGSAVVLDAKTGEVLAMVNVPSFNPNNKLTKSDSFRNRAVTDTFEPGSTIKAFSVVSALDSKKFKPNTVIDTTPGWMVVGGKMVKDHVSKGLLTVTQILQYSSNVGVTKMILTLPPNQLWDVLHRVGFGDTTGIQFPGEQNGMLVKHQPWGAFTIATLAFGYGLSVTLTQLTRAYDVLANNGVKLPISLLRLEKPPVGEQVISPQMAKEMLVLLEAVVAKGGTGHGASVAGYRVAGKTGTAKKVGVGGYLKHSYTSSFVGIAPVTNPRLVVAVVIHDPKGKQYYGGDVSGPVFEKVMTSTLRLLDVPPDADQVA